MPRSRAFLFQHGAMILSLNQAAKRSGQYFAASKQQVLGDDEVGETCQNSYNTVKAYQSNP